MVYKRYFYKNGKKFGPYYYESYRDKHGNVKKRYFGITDPNKKKSVKKKKRVTPTRKSNKLSVFILIIFIGIFSLFFVMNNQFVGKVTLFVEEDYFAGEQITGNLEMSLKQGELIPASTKILVDNSGEISEYFLSDLISEQITQGDFYAQGTSLSGTGQGYGVIGKKRTYPDVYFTLKFKKDKERGGGEDESEEEGSESSDGEEEEQEDGESEEGEDYDEAPITGEVIIKEKKNKVEATCSKENDFVYDLPEGKTAEIKKNSVKVEYVDEKGKTKKEEIGDDEVDLEVSDGQVIVSTDYYEEEQGFGEEYLTEEIMIISIDLSLLNLTAQQGELIISLVYGEEELALVSEEINVEEEPGEEPGETPTEEPGQNIIEPNVTQVKGTMTKHYKAVVGRPVKWIKVINTEGRTDLNVELPNKAKNITIKTQGEIQEALDELEEYEQILEDVDRKDIVDGTITGMVSLDIKHEQGFLTRLWKWLSGFSISGNAISEEEIGENIFEIEDMKIVEVDKIVNLSEELEVAIEYYTDSPSTVEENIANGKKVTVSADDEFGYEDILAYTLIEQNVVGVRIYQTVNGTKQLVDFVAHDFDSDGKIDYVEWVVPHLSEQVYEIIYITKAEHLDSNRTFISNIYDEVKEQDGIWSEVINDKEYVRITFEEELDNTKDITIYARAVNESSKIEVYEENSDEVLITFENVSGEDWYKVYLTSLSGTQDVFDLKVLGSVEFDYIVDPSFNITDESGTNRWSNGTFFRTETTSDGENVTLEIDGGKVLGSCPETIFGYYNSTDNGDGTCTLTFQPNANYGIDTYISNYDADRERNNYGISDVYSFGSIWPPFEILIRFNVSEIIPANATITKANLTLSSHAYGYGSSGVDKCEAFLITSDWQEGTLDDAMGAVNWTSAKTTTSWSTPGGDFDVDYVTSDSTWNDDTDNSISILKHVQAWVNGSKPEYGVMLNVTKISGQGSWYYTASSDYATPKSRPKLEITYKKPKYYYNGSYLSEVFDACSDSVWDELDAGVYNTTQKQNISFQVRSCDDDACSGESFGSWFYSV